MVRVVMVSYSRTGHTNALALEVSRRLSAAGLSVDSRQLRPARELGFVRTLRCVLGHGAEPCAYDPVDLKGASLVLLGTPVWGRGVAPYIRRFIRETKDLTGMPVVLFTTTANGDHRAAEELRGLVRERGGRPYAYEAWRINADGASGLDSAASRIVRATIELLPRDGLGDGNGRPVPRADDRKAAGPRNGAS